MQVERLTPEQRRITAAYADGGVVLVNPSPHGGTWAYALVSDGRTVAEASGCVTPAEIGLPVVSNNLTELYAVLMAAEALPAGWAGTLYSDSFVTLCRVRGGKKFAGIPDGIRDRFLAALGRLGRFESVLLGGHPSRAELLRGVRKDGLPVSHWNVRCDELCRHEAALLCGRLGI